MNNLVISSIRRQVILPPDIRSLLHLNSLQLGTLGDPVTQATAVAATTLVANVQVLLRLGLEDAQEGRDFLLRLEQKVLEIQQDGLLAHLVDERGRHAGLARPTGTTDPVDVVLDVLGHVVVYDVLDVWKVQTWTRKGKD